MNYDVICNGVALLRCQSGSDANALISKSSNLHYITYFNTEASVQTGIGSSIKGRNVKQHKLYSSKLNKLHQ